jgi:hypothetical protein
MSLFYARLMTIRHTIIYKDSRIKGSKIYPICGEATHSIHLKKCYKNIYLGHHKFLNRNHPAGGKKQSLMARSPIVLFRKEVSSFAKDINIIFGKKFEKYYFGWHMEDEIYILDFFLLVTLRG